VAEESGKFLLDRHHGIFGDGAFLGGVCPQVPLHLRRGGHLGLFMLAPSGDPHLFASYPRFRFAPPGAIHVGPLRGHLLHMNSAVKDMVKR